MGIVSGKSVRAEKREGSKGRVLLAAVFLLGICGNAGAIEIPAGTEDVQIRWDNTLRYSYATRVAKQDAQILNNPNADDGDRNFPHATVGNRFDLLSELDVVYKKDYGIRLSGTGWYDAAYEGNLPNRNIATTNHLVNGQPAVGGVSDEAKFWNRGPSGELLDAFTFGKFNIGEVPIYVKVGRHTIYWGESLLFGGAMHGISYGQAPIDVDKGLKLPGSEAKELFRPLTQVSIQVLPTKDLTIMGQYFMEWDAFRIPEGGTYLGFSDPLQRGGESVIAAVHPVLGALRLTRGADSEPSAFKNWGIGVRYSPDWLDGTLGIYYRKFADMMPQLATQVTNAPSPTNKNIGKYYLAYGDGIELAGISFAKQILGVSVGSELSYRWNMPLISKPVAVTSAPTDGFTPGARGETIHGVLNFLGTIANTPLFDSSTWAAEFVWNHLSSVSQNAAAFKWEGSGYSSIDRASRDYFGAGVNFTPTWYQVIPGVDVTMPLSYSRGLGGNSAVSGGGNHDSGTWSAGLGFDVFAQYKFDVKYVEFFGPIGSDLTPNGSTTAGLKDRDMVTLTLSTKF